MNFWKAFWQPQHNTEELPDLENTVLWLIIRQGEFGISSHDILEILGIQGDVAKANLTGTIGRLLAEDKIYHSIGTHIYFVSKDFLPDPKYLPFHDPNLANLFEGEQEFAEQIAQLSLLEMFVLYVAARTSGFRLIKDDKNEGNSFLSELNKIAYSEFTNEDSIQDPIPVFSSTILPDEYVYSLDAKGFFKPHEVYSPQKTSSTYRLKSVYLKTFVLREFPHLINQKIWELSETTEA